MSAHELLEWQAFERVFGPITVQERIDYAGAIAAWGAASAAGSKAPPGDFLPDWSGERAKADQSAEDMIAVMRGHQQKGSD